MLGFSVWIEIFPFLCGGIEVDLVLEWGRIVLISVVVSKLT